MNAKQIEERRKTKQFVSHRNRIAGNVFLQFERNEPIESSPVDCWIQNTESKVSQSVQLTTLLFDEKRKKYDERQKIAAAVSSLLRGHFPNEYAIQLLLHDFESDTVVDTYEDLKPRERRSRMAKDIAAYLQTKAEEISSEGAKHYIFMFDPISKVTYPLDCIPMNPFQSFGAVLQKAKPEALASVPASNLPYVSAPDPVAYTEDDVAQAVKEKWQKKKGKGKSYTCDILLIYAPDDYLLFPGEASSVVSVLTTLVANQTQFQEIWYLHNSWHSVGEDQEVLHQVFPNYAGC